MSFQKCLQQLLSHGTNKEANSKCSEEGEDPHWHQTCFFGISFKMKVVPQNNIAAV